MRPFRTSILLFCILILVSTSTSRPVFGAGKPLNDIKSAPLFVRPEEQWKECQFDRDCIRIITGCNTGSCYPDSINTKFEVEYHRSNYKQCSEGALAVLAIDCTLNDGIKSRCVKKKCEFIENRP